MSRILDYRVEVVNLNDEMIPSEPLIMDYLNTDRIYNMEII